MRGQPVMETVHVDKFVNHVGIYLDGGHDAIPFINSLRHKILKIKK